DGRTAVIDGHSHAPASVSPERLRPQEQRRGHRACTVPSTPATLAYVQERYGTLPAARVLEPAIRLAEAGYAATQRQQRERRWCRGAPASAPAAGRFFLKAGRPLPAGAVLRQKELAATLRRLARLGVNDFYRGGIARAIAADMREHGGFLKFDDL